VTTVETEENPAIRWKSSGLLCRVGS